MQHTQEAGHYDFVTGSTLVQVVVVLIGTNDLSQAVATYEDEGGAQGDCSSQEEAISSVAGGVAERVLAAVALLHLALPRAHVVLLGLLPRHHDRKHEPDAMEWPNSFTPVSPTVPLPSHLSIACMSSVAVCTAC